VTYDLHQVDPQNLPPLRDTLLTALERYHSGPRTIIVQLSLAISGLALQLPAWINPVQTLTDSFGRNPATVPTLLEFLTILPEEVSSNSRIPLSVRHFHFSQDTKLHFLPQDQEFRERSAKILTGNASRVLELLSMYINATGELKSTKLQSETP